MERMPVRKRGFSSAGVGVIERVDATSSRSALRVAFLLLPSFQDMINERKGVGYSGRRTGETNGSKLSETSFAVVEKIEKKRSQVIYAERGVATSGIP